MNIDERLDALTQSVELLTAMHKDNEEKFQRAFARLTDGLVLLGERNRRLEDLVTQQIVVYLKENGNYQEIAEGTARLVRTAQAHEQRISDLEDNAHQ